MSEKKLSIFRKIRKKHGIFLKSLPFAAGLVVLKLVVDHYGLTVLPLNALVTAFLGGVFFTIGILFAGAMADYKESEKIPGEIAVSLKTLLADSKMIPTKNTDAVKRIGKNIKELLYTINSNFRSNDWKLKNIDIVMNKINSDIEILSHENTPPAFLTKMRSELTNIDKMSHRIDIIKETTFLPAAYTIAKIAISSLLLILVFVKIEPVFTGPLFIGIISLVLISLVLLIQDIDDPFEFGKDSYADVDLNILFNLEEYWKKDK